MVELPPGKIIQNAVDFARDAFMRDGAEGETVHLLCDVAETYLAVVDAAQVLARMWDGEGFRDADWPLRMDQLIEALAKGPRRS